MISKPKIFDFIDVTHCFANEPKPLDFIFPGGPLASTVCGLTSQGGLGKSTFALELCIAVACSVDALGEPLC